MARRHVLLLALAACGDNRFAPDAGAIDARPDDAPIDGNPLKPTTLAGTGLCMDPGCTQISPDVHEYAPNNTLWADTATKRRWMFLPPGTTIDTSDMDHWQFPEGTKFWKEFTRDNVRVETRYIAKIGPGQQTKDWFFVSYEWNAAEDETTEQLFGVTNANGTQHDIPSQMDCKTCHEALAPSRILGFQAIQLDGATPLGLDDAKAMGWLSDPPAGSSPHFPIPGNATEKAAFGYLHANCGHCHNALSPIHDMTPMVLRLDTQHLAAATDTPAYTTTVDVMATIPYDEGSVHYSTIVKTGDPDNSAMIGRMNSMIAMRHMPNLGSEMVDPDGQTILRAWITNP
ncbi:MAG TPA: hypothetical protein VGO00_10190 [Kofleriaceae bacterium]|nr:hypothetical protein [Kofleriaceae bacterium]